MSFFGFPQKTEGVPARKQTTRFVGFGRLGAVFAAGPRRAFAFRDSLDRLSRGDRGLLSPRSASKSAGSKSFEGKPSQEKPKGSNITCTWPAAYGTLHVVLCSCTYIGLDWIGGRPTAVRAVPPLSGQRHCSANVIAGLTASLWVPMRPSCEESKEKQQKRKERHRPQPAPVIPIASRPAGLQRHKKQGG